MALGGFRGGVGYCNRVVEIDWRLSGFTLGWGDKRYFWRLRNIYVNLYHEAMFVLRQRIWGKAGFRKVLFDQLPGNAQPKAWEKEHSYPRSNAGFVQRSYGGFR